MVFEILLSRFYKNEKIEEGANSGDKNEIAYERQIVYIHRIKKRCRFTVSMEKTINFCKLLLVQNGKIRKNNDIYYIIFSS